MLPPTLLWGASFPLALAAAAAPGRWHPGDPGRLVGGVYAANTLGAILGALAFSLCWCPGSARSNPSACADRPLARERADRVPAAVCAEGTHVPGGRRPLAGAIGVLPVLLAWTVAPVPGKLIAYGRRIADYTPATSKILYIGEGLNSSIAISRGPMAPCNSRQRQGGSLHRALRHALQRMLGHLPALLQPEPRSVLVVGIWRGRHRRHVRRYPAVQRISSAKSSR